MKQPLRLPEQTTDDFDGAVLSQLPGKGGTLAKSIGKKLGSLGYSAPRGQVNLALERLCARGLAQITRVDEFGRDRWARAS